MYRPICVFVLLGVFGAAWGQGESPASLFAAGHFEDAAASSRAALEDNPDSGDAHFHLGASLYRLGDNEPALEHLKLALVNGYQPANAARIYLARVCVAAGRTDEALSELDRLASAGFAVTSVLDGTEFAALAGHVAFARVKERVHRNANPCLHGEEYQRLDFWLGRWDVFTATGQIGTNLITKGAGGCTLHEDYSTFGGFRGRSINYYDPADDRNKQVWVDKFNGITLFEESQHRENYLELKSGQPDGTVTRMSYQYDPESDTVVQTWESSADAGASWTTAFQGTYRRSERAETRVKETLAAMEQRFASDDMAAIADYYTGDGQIVEPGGRVIEGTDELRDYWVGLQGNGLGWTNELIEVGEAGDLVYSISLSTLSHQFEGRDVTDRSRALILWKETPNGYRIYRDFFHFLR